MPENPILLPAAYFGATFAQHLNARVLRVDEFVVAGTGDVKLEVCWKHNTTAEIIDNDVPDTDGKSGSINRAGVLRKECELSHARRMLSCRCRKV